MRHSDANDEEIIERTMALALVHCSPNYGMWEILIVVICGIVTYGAERHEESGLPGFVYNQGDEIIWHRKPQKSYCHYT